MLLDGEHFQLPLPFFIYATECITSSQNPYTIFFKNIIRIARTPPEYSIYFPNFSTGFKTLQTFFKAYKIHVKYFQMCVNSMLCMIVWMIHIKDPDLDTHCPPRRRSIFLNVYNTLTRLNTAHSTINLPMSYILSSQLER